jgi:YggT family protein
MFVLTNLLLAIAGAVNMLLTVYLWIVIGRVIVSWVNADPRNPIVRFLDNATEPLLWRLRRLLPPMGGLDLSPLLLTVGIYVVREFLVATLQDLAIRLQ